MVQIISFLWFEVVTSNDIFHKVTLITKILCDFSKLLVKLSKKVFTSYDVVVLRKAILKRKTASGKGGRKSDVLLCLHVCSTQVLLVTFVPFYAY